MPVQFLFGPKVLHLYFKDGPFLFLYSGYSVSSVLNSSWFILAPPEIFSGVPMAKLKFVLILAFLLRSQSAVAQSIPTAAQQQIEARIASSGADVAIAFRTLDGKSEFFFHADDAFHAASTMKVPVMIELFHQVQEGKLQLSDKLTIHNEFHSIVDGSPYHLAPADDSEIALYTEEGKTRTLSELCNLMITVSSNLATNLLIEKLGVHNVRDTVISLHAAGMNVLRGVEDSKAFAKGLNNTTTARGLQVLMTALAEGKAVDRDSSHQMVEILEQQRFNESIPAGLPPGILVAHKTGEITKIHHDAAIVFAPRPFVLVILVRGLADIKDSSVLMSDIARILYLGTE
jgi:beta-lactamase class A